VAARRDPHPGGHGSLRPGLVAAGHRRDAPQRAAGPPPDIDPQHFDDTTIAALRRAFPDAWVEVPDELVAEMDNAPEDRHVLAAAVAAGAQVLVTANTAHFRSARFVDSGQVAVHDPASFLLAVLDEHQELMAAVLEHLASNRRTVAAVADVLDALDRNEALRPFVEVARERLL
jgi:hypothetical protein